MNRSSEFEVELKLCSAINRIQGSPCPCPLSLALAPCEYPLPDTDVRRRFETAQEDRRRDA